MKLLPSLIMFTAAVSACSDPALRCKNPEGSKAGDYSKTVEICAEVGNGASMCYCWGAGEDYCYLVNGNNQEEFASSCTAEPAWYTESC
ncbi:uncharacterized protein N7458_002783 [Penicillium daleae]|uniref:Extracellular membrane protein CFEM domain-containing protein n=1 Tax=Penicillium daleae TaxID=63821 RepID=A0AAD6CE93_9EURO|nr:uncharacterized protein N7458_002783 [Penicillium daleae]KAJ5461231.1 hypothetical protein N7458_002783 [Penicillium daleae]